MPFHALDINLFQLGYCIQISDRKLDEGCGLLLKQPKPPHTRQSRIEKRQKGKNAFTDNYKTEQKRQKEGK